MATVVPFPGPAAPDAYHLVGAAELFAPLPPIDWLSQGLRIGPGAPTLLAGYGYSGKSLFAQAICLAVAAGRPCIGRFGVRQGRVLHLDYEQGRRLTADRYQRLARAERIDPGEVVGRLEAGILPSVGLDLESCKWAGDGRALVLVDSWRAAWPGIDENSSEVRPTLDAAGKASEVTGCTFVVLHHARKPSDTRGSGRGSGRYSIRGSSGFYDGSGTVYVFEEGGGGREPTVRIEKERTTGTRAGGIEFGLAISDEPGGGLCIRASEVEQADAAPRLTEERVLEFLRDVGPCHLKELREGLLCSQTQLVAVLQSAKQSGRIEVGKSGYRHIPT